MALIIDKNIKYVLCSINKKAVVINLKNTSLFEAYTNLKIALKIV